MINYSIAKQYTEIPGPRYIKEGNFSGEDFREKVLIPTIKEAKERKEKIFIDLDGGYGYPTSFLEESFGGAVRKTNDKNLIELFEFKSDEEPSLIDEIKQYMQEAINNLR